MNFSLTYTKNTRDLGEYSTATGTALRCDQVIRSELPDKISEQDIALLSERHIHLCLDLRTAKEVIQRHNAFLDVPDMRVEVCTIPGGERVPEVPEQVASNYLTMVSNYDAMGNIFRYIAAADSGVVICCNAGKDRTGVVSALMLMVSGVGDDLIIQDYAKTGTNLAEDLRWYAGFANKPIEVVMPREDYMSAFLQLFRGRYKTIDEYLRLIGLTQIERHALKQKLKRVPSDICM